MVGAWNRKKLAAYFVNFLKGGYADYSTDIVLNRDIPKQVEQFFLDMNIKSMEALAFGNNILIPDINTIELLQWGYSYNPKKKEKIESWPDNWYVIACQGADPFVFEAETQRILCSMHGMGVWEPREGFFSDIDQFFWVIAITAGCLSENKARSIAGDDIDPTTVKKAKEILIKNYPENEIINCLGVLGW